MNYKVIDIREEEKNTINVIIIIIRTSVDVDFVSDF